MRGLRRAEPRGALLEVGTVQPERGGGGLTGRMTVNP